MIKKEINILKTEDSPTVHYDAEHFLLKIEGPSLMNSPMEFYSQLINWAEGVVDHIQTPIEINIHLSYINSSSSKYIMKFLLIADQKHDLFRVKWYYNDYDLVMKEKGQEVNFLLKMPVKLVVLN